MSGPLHLISIPAGVCDLCDEWRRFRFLLDRPDLPHAACARHARKLVPYAFGTDAEARAARLRRASHAAACGRIDVLASGGGGNGGRKGDHGQGPESPSGGGSSSGGGGDAA